MSALEEIHRRIHVCTACNLHKSRTHAVPGEGPAHARVMFIGEGPGYNEDQQGRPFVGAAGNLLNELLGMIGLRREDVFITNMVKCRPPQNRDPFPIEIETCSGYLDGQIAEIKPDAIVPLGRHALGWFFPGGTIGALRAKPRKVGDVTVFPLYHPAAALHNGALKPTLEQDFRKLGDLLARIRQEREKPAAPPSPAKPGDKQLSMF